MFSRIFTHLIVEMYYSYDHSFEIRLDPTGQPGPGTGPGLSKNQPGIWSDKTRSRPDLFLNIYIYIYIYMYV